MADDGTPDDSGLGGYGGAGGYGSFTPLLSPVAQAMHMDPRFALANAIMQTGQQGLQQPTYNMGSALAKALTMGIGGLTTVELQKQYAGANAGDTAQHLADTLPENHPLRAALTSKDPVVRMYAMQGYGPAMGNLGKVMALSPTQVPATAGGTTTVRTGVPMTTDAQRLADAATLAPSNPAGAAALNSITAGNAQKDGITYALGGGASVVPGADDATKRMAYVKALGGGVGTGQADLAYKPAIAGGVARAELDPKLDLAAFNIRNKVNEVRPGNLAGTMDQLGIDTSGLGDYGKPTGALGLRLPGGNLPPMPSPAQASPAAAQPATPTPSVAASGFNTPPPVATPDAGAAAPPAPKPETILPKPAPGGVYNSPERAARSKDLADQTTETEKSMLAAQQMHDRLVEMRANAPNANLGSFANNRTAWDNFLETVAPGGNYGKAATSDQVIDKLTTQLAGDQTSSLGQHANAALQTFKAANPHRELTPTAFNDITGILLGVSDYSKAEHAARQGFISKNGTADGFTDPARSDFYTKNSPLKFALPYISDEGLAALQKAHK